MHIFSTNETEQGSITFQLKNTDSTPKTLYFSYELTAPDKPVTTTATNENFKPLFELYNTLSERIQRREFMIRTMINVNEKHTQDLVESRRKAVHYALFETILLAVTFGLSLLFVYRNVRRKRYSVV